MWKQYLRIAFRSHRKKPIYSIISILGFTVGIAASLLIYLWVYDELSFEKFHPDYDRIYRVLTLKSEAGQIKKVPSSYRPLARAFKQEYPQIESATYLSYSSENSPMQLEGSDKKVAVRECWTNPDFFNVFQGFRFIEGSAEGAFEQADDIVLNQEVAHKLFGNESALGKTVVINKFGKKVYRVGAVVNVPRQSHIDFDFLISDKNSRVRGYLGSWRDSYWTRCYIKLRDDVEVSAALVGQMSNLVTKYQKRPDKLMFQPIDDIHLYSDYEAGFADRHVSTYKYVYIFGALALLIIGMVIFNFVSLTIARASERVTEVGLRKVAGSARLQLYGQFVAEALAQTIIATLLALLLLFAFLPWFESLTQKPNLLHFSPMLMGSLLLITISIGVVSGIYPAFYLTSFNPVQIFKGANPTGSKALFTRALVLTQFSVAIVLIIFTAVIYKQLRFIQDRDLGVQRNDMVVVETGLWYSIGSFKQELLDNPNILSVSAATSAPLRPLNEYGFRCQGASAFDTIRADLFWVDEDFATTYNLELVKGQFLMSDYGAYWREHQKRADANKKEKRYTMSFPVVINESFARKMNVDDPIGMRLNHSYVVVGVVKDFHIHSLHSQISPLLMTNDPQCMGVLNIRINGKNRAQTLAYIKSTYEKHRSGREIRYHFFDDELNERYFEEFQLGDLLLKFSLLAILIALLGILGLSTFVSERRIKEIGIRKVNGARVSEILLMLNMSFIRWVVVAFVITVPLAWYMSREWLTNFAYQTQLSWWIFAGAGVVVLLLALVTVTLQSNRVANQNPIESLRFE